ncbi:hypothetical protein TRICI_003410 [Trichomonascus ciferrii]|uniref:catechol O-methyltransferase n=1 Tax=Trichomonascus ciferrii TaxID=44093 RepID=A0A642V3X8_9ASCO|nr:hypothetical protein TRICI_003410 [Trichomonascus ciferrii]
MSSKEQRLREYIFSLPQSELKDKPDKILEAIDKFSEKEHLMNIGQKKGNLVVSKMGDTKVMAELGGYMGYSAIKFAAALPSDGKYYSFEVNEEFANIARDLIKLAGLSDKIEIILGEAKDTLLEFSEAQNRPKKFDAVFIDHWKTQYTPDLRTLESLGLIGPGTVVMADNTLVPGAPEYLEYIRMSPEDKKNFIRDHANPNGTQYPGRWDIQWQNESFQFDLTRGDHTVTDAVEVSRFVKYQD